MKKLFLFTVIFIISLPAYSDRKVIKTDSKKFNSMKSCVEWLDSNYPNMEWHKNGGPWDMLYDTPDTVIGATMIKSANGKSTHPVGIECHKRVTGTKGTYFEGTYSVLE